MKAIKNIDDALKVVKKIEKHFDELPAGTQDVILWQFKGAELVFNQEMMRLRIAKKSEEKP